MSRQSRAGGVYAYPIDSNGAELTEGEHGKYTLASGTTYFFILGGRDASRISVQLTSYTAGLVITSATIQDCNHGDLDVTNQSAVAGEWLSEVPSTAYVATTGSGWTVSNGVVASTGSALGGALWHVADTGAWRTRLAVVVGGTGGIVRVSTHGKD